MKNSKLDVTIFIPTWYGEKYLNEVLVSIYSQITKMHFEILIIDTNSKDNTLNIIDSYKSKYKNIRIFHISKKEFNHGLTRQRAAEIAFGKYVIYLTQDAIPAHNKWLEEIIKPFSLNKDIVAVLGRQRARKNAPPFLKREIKSVFNNLGNEDAVSLFYKSENENNLDFLGFYSDVNSATLKDFLIHKIPYRKADYAEDQIFGREIIDAGYIKAYAPKAEVIHSNDFNVLEYGKRIFDEVYHLHKLDSSLTFPPFIYILKESLKHLILDTFFAIKDTEYNYQQKLNWLIKNPAYILFKWIGYYRALHYKNISNINKYSLEKSKSEKLN
jgi:rhamnosyltransferase